MQVPAAVVWYGPDSFGDNPRRRLTLGVIVCVDGSIDSVWTTLAGLCDSVITLLDEQVSGDAVFRIGSVEPINTDSALVSRLLKFNVEDH